MTAALPTGYLTYPTWLSPTVIPGFPVRWYGILYLAAFAVTFLLFRHEMRRRGLAGDSEQLADFAFWTIFGLLVGGRLVYVLAVNPDPEYLQRPWLVFWPFEDGRFTGIRGMSFHGGFLGAVIAAVVYTRVRKLDTLAWGDTMAVAVPLGYALGRMGNFINGELVGRATAAPWGMLFPSARRFPASNIWVPILAHRTGIPIYDHGQLVNLPRHPSQLYEAALEGLLLWLVLWFVFRKRQLFSGALIALYTAGYGVARFFAGYFREAAADSLAVALRRSHTPIAMVSHGLALTGEQLVSLGMIVAGFAALVVFRLIHKPAPTIETFEG